VRGPESGAGQREWPMPSCVIRDDAFRLSRPSSQRPRGASQETVSNIRLGVSIRRTSGVGPDEDLDTAVLLPAFRRIVAGNRLRLAATYRPNACARDTLPDQDAGNGLGATL
jgi:hypothetical protein